MADTMKICLVSQEYPPETGWGGIGTYTYETAQGLAALGHEVHVITKAVKKERQYRDGKVIVHRIFAKTSRLSRFLRKFLPMHNLLYSMRVAEKVRELTQKYGVQIVEFPDWGAEGFFYAFDKEIPTIVKFHTPMFVTARLNDENLKWKDKVVCWMEKFTSQRADHFAAPSHLMAELIEQEYGINQVRIKVMPLPINQENFMPDFRREKKQPTVLYVGRMEPRKGVQILADAIPDISKKIENVKFVFIGKDIYDYYKGISMQEYILEKANKEATVQFITHIKREKLIDYYREATLCIVPSIWENFGYTALEALSCGRPLILSDKVGLSQHVAREKFSINFKSGDVKDLTKKVTQLLKDKEMRLKLRTKSRSVVAKYFSRESVSIQAADYYRQLIQTKNKKPIRKKKLVYSGS